MRLPSATLTLARALAVALLTLNLVSAGLCASKFRVLHSFGGADDGRDPSGPPLLDGKRNLYGATGRGPGPYGEGTVYKLTPQAKGTWSETILHDFAAGNDGAIPWGALVFDSVGHLYGTVGGDGGAGGSGVFDLSPGSGDWGNKLIYDKSSGPGLLTDKMGNLYGDIGPGLYTYHGAVGELLPGSDGWTYAALYNFCSQQDCPDGYDMPAPPIWDGKGNLFGTTSEGGGRPTCWISFGCGVIFEMTPNGDGTWKYHVLHRFASSKNDGQTPAAGLIMDSAGNFYGSTAAGGPYGREQGGYGNGTVFKLALVNGKWEKTDLYDFPNCSNGCNPGYQMAFDKAGNLYGAANGGLPDCDGYDCGVVFKLSPQAGGKWTYSVVHKFTAADGEYPLGLIIDGKGNLFGTTQSFGKYHFGTAFEITP
jgi:uncharacterized repeat protein (TIGR03803 family)